MKLLYLCSDLGIPLDGHKGASAHIRGFVSALRELGIDTQVLSPNGGSFAPERISKSRLFDNLETAIPKRMSRALRHITSNCLVESAMEDSIQEARPDLIYERYSPFAIAGGIVAEAHQIPHILEVNAPLSREGATFRAQALPEVAEAMELRAFETAGHIVTVSEELREELVHSGIDGSKITTIPNGVDATHFSQARSTPRRSQYDNKVVVGFVGSLKPWHDIESMLRTFQHLTEDDRFHFLIVGDGPEMKRIKKFKKEHPTRITVTGALDHENVRAELGMMDIALAPYPEMAGFYFSPLKILEYMAAGCAIVGSNIGQVGSLIEHGKTGLLTTPGDDLELTAAIKQLADDEELRRRLGNEAARIACQEHDWKSRVKEVLEIGKALER